VVRRAGKVTATIDRSDSTEFRGVATGWTGEATSTPLLPGGVPAIDPDPVIFFGDVGGRSRLNFDPL